MFMGHAAADGPWSARDRELAQALTLYEAMECGGCGLPLSETTDPDREGWYTADVVVCAGCQARERAMKDDGEPGAKIAVSLDAGYAKRI